MKKPACASILFLAFPLLLGACSFKVTYAGIDEEKAYEVAKKVDGGVKSVLSEDVDAFSYRYAGQTSFDNWDSNATENVKIDFERGKYLSLIKTASSYDAQLVPEEEGSVNHRSDESDSESHSLIFFTDASRYFRYQKDDGDSLTVEYMSEESYQKAIEDAFAECVEMVSSFEASAKKAIEAFISKEEAEQSSSAIPSGNGMDDYLVFRDFSTKNEDTSLFFSFAGHGKVSVAPFQSAADYGGRVDYKDFYCVRSDSYLRQEMTPKELCSAFGADVPYWTERQTRKEVFCNISSTERVEIGTAEKTIPLKVLVNSTAA